MHLARLRLVALLFSRALRGASYLTESVDEDVLKKSIPAQIRHFILYIIEIKDKLTDLSGN